MTYIRVTIGRWYVDLTSTEAKDAIRKVCDEGLSVFRDQPGFISYRLMRADARTTIAVAEWQSEELGKAGARRFRAWLASSGIAKMLSLDTYDGDLLVASSPDKLQPSTPPVQLARSRVPDGRWDRPGAVRIAGPTQANLRTATTRYACSPRCPPVTRGL